MNKKVLTLLTAALTVVTIAACSENLEGGKSCPLLCPEQAVILADTTVDAVVADTTVPGLPPIGSEGYLMLASHGDTLETRAIVRFDTLPQSYNKSSLDSTIVHIDTALLIIPIVKPDSTKRPTAPVTIEVYNVDTTAADTVTSALATLFRPDRFLGSKTFAPESLLDTLRMPISTDSVLTRVLAGTRLRVGFRVRSSVGIDLRIGTTHVGLPVTLNIYASTDTASRPAIVSPQSNTPTDVPFLSTNLSDYTIVLKGGTSTPSTILGVGGVPSRRVYMRFDVPSHIVDSTTIVRASLLLTQVPNRRLGLLDDHRSRIAAAHPGAQSPIRAARLGVRLPARGVGRARGDRRDQFAAVRWAQRPIQSRLAQFGARRQRRAVVRDRGIGPNMERPGNDSESTLGRAQERRRGTAPQ